MERNNKDQEEINKLEIKRIEQNKQSMKHRVGFLKR
jgi:hypothetical protein